MNDEAESSYTFRPYLNDDIPFIQNSWGSSYYKGANYSKYLSPEEFHKSHRPIRESLFKKPNIAIVLAVAEKDSSLILGWVAVEKPAKSPVTILHYIYVKQAFKDLGIASELLHKVTNHNSVLYTHLTDKAERLMHKKRQKYFNYHYCPHLT